MDSSSSSSTAKAAAMPKILAVGSKCELTIYSSRGTRKEIYDCTIIEMGAAVARVQIWGGGILRVCVSQLKAF